MQHRNHKRWLPAIGALLGVSFVAAGAVASPNYARLNQYRQNTLNVAEQPRTQAQPMPDYARLHTFRLSVTDMKPLFSEDAPSKNLARLHQYRQNTFIR